MCILANSKRGLHLGGEETKENRGGLEGQLKRAEQLVLDKILGALSCIQVGEENIPMLNNNHSDGGKLFNFTY